MTTTEVHSSILREQAAAGVEVVPPELRLKALWKDDGGWWFGANFVGADAASLILVGAMAGFLNDRGYAVIQVWDGVGLSWFLVPERGDWTPLDATDHLAALHAATVRVLRTLAEGRGKE